MKIENNKVVAMHYLVKTEDGTEIDSSLDSEPLHFVHGQGYLIPGLEDALVGKAAGDKFEVDVVATEAYGERIDELVQVIPKSMFDGMEVEVGLQFRATTDQGEQSVIVIDVNDDEVVVDGNHPLAGHNLSFDVEILNVREASEEELAEAKQMAPEEEETCKKGCCD